MGLTTDDFQVGQKVLSKDHKQPGVVVDCRHWDSNTFSGWFEVEWVRHPGKTRVYHTGSDGRHLWEASTWPTPVNKFDWEDGELASDRLVFVDPIADAKDSLKVAFAEAATLNGDDVVIDVNKLFSTLANNGWFYKGE